MSRIDRAVTGCVAVVGALGALTTGYETAKAAWAYRNCTIAVSNQYRIVSLLLQKNCTHELTRLALTAGATFLLASVTIGAISRYKKVVRVLEPPISSLPQVPRGTLHDFVPAGWSQGGIPEAKG